MTGGCPKGLLMPIVLDILRSVFSRAIFWNRYALTDRGFGLIYDSERDITWLKDANYAKTLGRTPDGQMNWYDATAWVSRLSYRGVKGWRLPSALNQDGSGPCLGQGCSGSEIGSLFLDASRPANPNVKAINFQNNAKYWNSTEASATDVYGFDLFSLRQGTLPKDPFSDPLIQSEFTLTGPILVWPVHEGDVSSTILARLFSFIFTWRQSSNRRLSG